MLIKFGESNQADFARVAFERCCETSQTRGFSRRLCRFYFAWKVLLLQAREKKRAFPAWQALPKPLERKRRHLLCHLILVFYAISVLAFVNAT